MTESIYKIKGGALTVEDNTYVPREADEQVYQFAKSRHKNNRICTVFAGRQMGKSSLMERTINRLLTEEVYCVCINLHELAEVNSDKELWKSILEEICNQVPSASRNFKEELDKAWRADPDSPPAKRFTKFLLSEILPNTGDKIISIFLDEVQSIVAWGLEDSFVRYMKAIAENSREPLLQRLNFVFLGVAKPSDFVTNQGATFNVGQQIDIDYLSGDCLPLQEGIAAITDDLKKAISRVLWNTGGQPFLTQYVCYQAVTNFPEYINSLADNNFDLESYIDFIVDEYVVKSWRSDDKQKHFLSIENSFIRANEAQRELKLSAFKVYEKICNGTKVYLDESNLCHNDLIITGLVRKYKKNGQTSLVIANRIYQAVFNDSWRDKIGSKIAQQFLSNYTSIPNADSGKAKVILINEALRILRRGLLPFVEKQMTDRYGDNWLSQIEGKIPKYSVNNQVSQHLDTLALLKIIWEEWNSVFKNTPICKERSLVSELRNVRNKASHDETFTDRDIYRALDSIEHLLKAISADEEAGEIERMRISLGREIFRTSEQRSDEIITSDGTPLPKVSNTNNEDLDTQPETAALPQATVNEPKEKTINSNNLIKPMPRSNMGMIEQIEGILAQREIIVEKIKVVESNLTVLEENLAALEELQKKIVAKVDPNGGNFASQVNLQMLKSMILHELDNLVKLRKRLSRKYLTFGTIGFMGHGKSTLLQNISGLTNNEIPARSGDACTAVCSAIYFHQGDTYATVKFHTAQTFLDEVIASFYKKLGLGSHPTTLDDFSKPLPKFSGKATSTEENIYSNLKKYQEKLPLYRHLLSTSTPKKLSGSETSYINKYVAQQANSFEYFAVREVEIHCHTDREELTKVALVDIPGEGDFNPLDEKLMRNALEDKVDLVFFVNRADPVRYQWTTPETNLYVKAGHALNNLSNRSFMILNLFNGNSNLESCQNRQNTARQYNIDVARCEIVNCSNKEDVSRVFNIALEYLAANLQALDRKYAEPYQNGLDKLHQNLSMQLERLRESGSGLSVGYLNDQEKFDGLFKKFWSNLTRNLGELVTTLDSYADDNQEAVAKTKVEKIIRQCQENKGIPSNEEDQIENSIKEVTQQRDNIGDWSSAYSAYLNDARTNLTQHLHSIDHDLKEKVEQAKSLVKDVFISQDLLGKLVDSELNGSDFLKFMIERIPERLVNLRKAFTTLLEFEMSYRSNFHYRIRPLLSNLNPNTTKLPVLPIQGKETKEAQKEKALEIIELINELYAQTVYNCQDALGGFYSEPSQAALAEVEAFVDQVLRAKDIQTEWRSFLFQERASIWASEYGRGVVDERQGWVVLTEIIC